VAFALTAAVGLVAAAGRGIQADPPAGDVTTAVHSGQAEKPAVVAGDLAAIQGNWDGEQILEGGAIPNQPVPWGRCVVLGDIAWLLPADDYYCERRLVRLAADRNPKWIDLTSDGCSAYVADRVAGAVKPGIYRITSDGWEVTLPTGPGKFRPAEFETDPASQIVAVRFRRGTSSTGATRDADRTRAGRELAGRWAITRQAYPHDDRSAMVDRAVGVAEITPEFLFVQRPCDGAGKNFVWEAAELTVDPTKSPKWIDLKVAGRAAAYKSGYGVYEVNGDVLRISYRVSVPRALRTLEFKAGIEEPLASPAVGASKPDDRKPACSLLELKRQGTP
jgi:uncharacterized protein (TIGR03067 family)